jgi:hypothetical protein
VSDDTEARQAEIRRLLDFADMADTATRSVLHATLLMEWAAELREERAQYLENLQMLRERGHQAEPDQETLAAVDTEIVAIQEMSDQLFDQHDGGGDEHDSR